MSNDDILATLRSPSLDIANAFLAAFPNRQLTSGKRTVLAQAHAMATNIVHFRNWIVGEPRDATSGPRRRTYVPSPARDACQAWLDANPDVTDLQGITAGLASALAQFQIEDLRRLSQHLAPDDQGADAFDAEPDLDANGTPTSLNDAMASFLQNAVSEHVAAGGEAKLLTEEGGIPKLHVQATPIVAT